MKKIDLKFEPYTFARICAMKSKLLSDLEYQKIAKMSLNEILAHLEKTDYSKEINELSMDFLGAELLEQAIDAHFINTIKKLSRISTGTFKKVIEGYSKRFDLMNLKSIIRVRYSGHGFEWVEKMLYPGGKLSEDDISELMKLKNPEEIITASKLFPGADFTQGIKYLKSHGSLFVLENELDFKYFSDFFNLVLQISRDGRFLSEYFTTEMDFLNIKNIINLIRAGFKEEEILKYVLPPSHKLKSQHINELAGARNMGEFMEFVEMGPYGHLLGDEIRGLYLTDDIVKLELAMDRHLLKKMSVSYHAKGLSVNSMIGYLFSKEIEVRTLKKIVKSKQFGMSEEFLEDMMKRGN